MEQGELGFVSIEQEIRIQSPPQRVFAALTEEKGQWWPAGFYGGRVSLEWFLSSFKIFDRAA